MQEKKMAARVLGVFVMCLLAVTQAQNLSSTSGPTTANGSLSSTPGPTTASGSPSSTPGTTTASGSPSSTPGTTTASGSPSSTPGTTTASGSPSSTPGTTTASGTPSSTPGTTTAIGTPSSTPGTTTASGTPSSTPGTTAANGSPTNGTTKGPSTTTIAPVSKTTMKLTLEIQFEETKYDNAVNGTTSEGKILRVQLCDLVIKINRKALKIILRCKVIEVRKVNSVVVKYELVVNATSREQAQEVTDAIQKQINSGKIGNSTVEPNHPIGATITMIVDGTPATEAPTKTSAVSTTLIILLSVGVFLLVVVIILVIVMIAKLAKGGGS